MNVVDRGSINQSDVTRKRLWFHVKVKPYAIVNDFISEVDLGCVGDAAPCIAAFRFCGIVEGADFQREVPNCALSAEHRECHFAAPSLAGPERHSDDLV